MNRRTVAIVAGVVAAVILAFVIGARIAGNDNGTPGRPEGVPRRPVHRPTTTASSTVAPAPTVTTAPAPPTTTTTVPAPGATTTTAAPGCTGVGVAVGQLTNSYVGSFPEGTTFCVRAGTHLLEAGGIAPRARTTFIGEPGAILDGQGAATFGIYGYGGSTGQHHVTVRGLTIRNVAGRALKMGQDWTVTDNVLEHSGIGADVGDRVYFARNVVRDMAQYAIVGGPGTGMTFEDNELAGNNTCRCHPGDEGATKIVGSTAGSSAVVWRRNYVHDNTGPGIWSDGNVSNVTYESNRVVNNSGPGIFHEISWTATITGNTLSGNNSDNIGDSCWWGAQIHLNNSQHVTITGNSIAGAGNAICVVDADRGEAAPYPTSAGDVTVTGNTINSSGQAGLVGRANNGVRFDGNRWTRAAGQTWAAVRYPLTWDEFRAAGMEPTGTLAG